MLRSSETARNVALFIEFYSWLRVNRKDGQSSPIMLIITFKHIIRVCRQSLPGPHRGQFHHKHTTWSLFSCKVPDFAVITANRELLPGLITHDHGAASQWWGTINVLLIIETQRATIGSRAYLY